MILGFLAIAAVVVATPGPDTALTIRNTLMGGRRAGVLTALGVVSGLAVWTAAAAIGLAALLVELQRALQQSHALTDAAEAHGTLVGSLCASGCSLDEWLAEILPEGRADEHCSVSLQAIFNSTSNALVICFNKRVLIFFVR